MAQIKPKPKADPDYTPTQEEIDAAVAAQAEQDRLDAEGEGGNQIADEVLTDPALVRSTTAMGGQVNTAAEDGADEGEYIMVHSPRQFTINERNPDVKVDAAQIPPLHAYEIKKGLNKLPAHLRGHWAFKSHGCQIEGEPTK